MINILYRLKICWAPFMALLCAGCSVISPGSQRFTVTTNPSSADIYLNDKLAGKGRVTEQVRGKDGVAVKVMAPGYVTYEKYVPGTLSSSGMADLIGAFLCLAPGVGLLFPGAHKLTEESLEVTMESGSSVRAPAPVSSGTTVAVPAKTVPHRFAPIQLPPFSGDPVAIAVADLKPNALSDAEVRTLSELLRNTLVETDYFRVLSEADMKQVLQHQQFQASGACDDTQCLVEMGRVLAVHKMVSGSVGRVGTTYSVVLRMVDVESGETELTVSERLRCEPDELFSLVEQSAYKLVQKHASRL